ncbi:sodium transport ATPase 5 [Cordyceps militaris]|uniref:P-type Na(+) transporter n=1 Tax=Cordyceps militaris TaxID=73501 RepID=A0A2H4SMT4_CORMI|nr:sodium transport ATPase 5 [Cordyceps militaris]
MSSNSSTAPETPPSAAYVSGQSNTPMSRPAHSMSSEETLKQLRADPLSGLSSYEAAQRLTSAGRNELEQKKGVQPVKIFIEQIFNAMTLVLLLALAASFGIRAWIEGGILGGIILLNIFIGYVQTLQAERTIASLGTLGTPTCSVFRDGATVTVQTAEVVPGDVVHLSTGDAVPADMRLLDAVHLEVDEALLTGEAAPVSKMPALVLDEDTGPGDRLNVVFSSTTVTKGRGRGVVFATGMGTEIGLIASALQGHGRPTQDAGAADAPFKRAWRGTVAALGEFLGLTVGTPLQRKLAQLFLGLLAFAIVCAVIVLGANEFNTQTDVILYAVTTAIGTIPVSLLLVLTVTMAAGTKKMLQRHVIVRNLQSLEALGGVTNVCSDKTGTITQGRMVVRKAWLPGCGTYSVETGNDVYNPTVGQVSLTTTEPKHMTQTEEKRTSVTTIVPTEHVTQTPALQWYLNIASLANLATLEQGGAADEKESGEWKARGAPTEIAMEVFASRFGWNRILLSEGSSAKWNHVAEFPFDSDVKKMSVVFRDTESKQTHVFTKGAVERVLEICTIIAYNNDMQPLTDEAKDNILANMEALASQGLRVLALAHKINDISITEADVARGASLPPRATVEHGLVFRGLVGIYDPPRPESAPSVRAFHGAGIAVHMLTGDHPETARAIAQDVGILPPEKELHALAADVAASLMMTAQRFDALSDEQMDALPQLPLVVARCAPSTKVRMIEALHRRGRYVAMTGDGVNDSPSLKRADIGIAMGTGSDVAKESSDIVLTDDNFASILNAIEEGRRIFDNIQKFILHVLAANIGFVISLLVGLSFKDRQGVSVFLLSPVEILWMLLGTGAFSETGLGFEKAVPDILNRPPHNLQYGVFTPEFVLDMVVYGLIMAGCVLGSFTTVLFGFDNGNLGVDCNRSFSPACDQVFRARATCYATMTWIFLLFSWELIDFRRSLFYMPSGMRAWAAHLWSNKFLFFSVTIVFAVVFPTIYIPGLNHVVFLHTGITWEWAVVFVSVGVWMAGTESWKWMKRAYFRRATSKTQTAPGVSVV